MPNYNAKTPGLSTPLMKKNKKIFLQPIRTKNLNHPIHAKLRSLHPTAAGAQFFRFWTFGSGFPFWI
jgi:hypothetical protein